jgi:hypothetical protein
VNAIERVGVRQRGRHAGGVSRPQVRQQVQLSVSPCRRP